MGLFTRHSAGFAPEQATQATQAAQTAEQIATTQQQVADTALNSAVPNSNSAVPNDADAAQAVAPESTGLRGVIARLKAKRVGASLKGDFTDYAYLLAMKPRERMVFRSDYFEIDETVATILSFFHDEGSQTTFNAFWGIDRIPYGLDDNVTAVVLEQVSRMSDKWVDTYSRQSENIDKLDLKEQADDGSKGSRRKAAKVSSDLDIIAAELQDGASYLAVHNRLLLKAPDLQTLEEAIDHIARLYVDRFGTLKAAAYAGEQRKELSTLWHANERKRGSGFHYTSTEFAGSYALVTNGLNDREGQYVGYMVGDVNNSAVLMNVNAFGHHVVIADDSVSKFLDRQSVSNMWCSKISQDALLNNASVVHLVLDGTDLNKLGPSFSGLTARVDLNVGDVNPFELFGEVEDELSIFAAHIEKLKLMFTQLHESADGAVNTIIDGALEKTATDFYVDADMWRYNAKTQRQNLRLVGLPHNTVPTLKKFETYLSTALKAEQNKPNPDQNQLQAYNVLVAIAGSMLSTNGDLFDTYTASGVDGVRDAQRVVYDFSRLLLRGKRVAMAQLVNIIGFAVGKLTEGDVLIVHGAENIDVRVKPYLAEQFNRMSSRGGRIVYSYNSVESMLTDNEFNRFDAADYTILGPMADRTVAQYQSLLHSQIPPDLAKLITTGGDDNLSYLRRGHSNVVFHVDLALGVNPAREKQRRKIAQEAAAALAATQRLTAQSEAAADRQNSQATRVLTSRSKGGAA